MLSCSHYDQLELICLKHYPVRLVCHRQQQNGHHDQNGEMTDVVEGFAVDMFRNDDKEECIKLRSGDNEILMPLAHICRVDVLIDNPHITSIVMT